MNLFWGCAFILAGLIIIINVIFGISIPVTKILFASFLIYLGLKMLLPSSNHNFSSFSSYKTYHTATSEDKENYSVCFSSSVIDLTHLTSQTAPQTITINTQCANVVVLLPKTLPLRVKANVHFATVNLPGHKMSSEYVNLHGASAPHVTIYINSQFSNVIVKE